MSSAPTFPVPPSLDAYVRLFESDPMAAIERMEAARLKRRTDPVLNIWLCWMHLRQGDRSKALKAARLAETQAPGSPVTGQLRYAVCHPDGFAALDPDWRLPSATNPPPASTDAPFDLDTLINRLTFIGKSKIKPDATAPTHDMAELSAKRGGVATATIASVHEKQGRYAEALAIYEHLSAGNPAKADIYAPHIARLRALLAQTD